MKINSVEISNFRKLKSFSLDFQQSDSNLIFINGTNGNGKSTLLSALRWCFFGEGITPSTYSYEALRTLHDGDYSIIEVNVKLARPEFADSVSIKRAQEVRCVSTDQGKAIQLSGIEDFVISISPDDYSSPATVVQSPANWLEENLPQRFKRFILFDGELMYKFFDLSVKGAIEDAVREIAKIDQFEEAVNAVNEIHKRKNQRIAKLAGSAAEKIQAELEDLERRRARALKDVRYTRSEKDKVELKISDAQSFLRGKENLEVYLDKNRKLRDDLDLEVGRFAQADAQLAKMLMQTGVNSILLASSAKPLQRFIKSAEEAGKYPADFSVNALNALLAQGVCLCGRDLGHDSIDAQHVQKVIDKNLSAGDLGKILKELEVGLNRIDATMLQLKRDSDLTIKVRKDASDARKRISSELEALAPHLEGVSGNHGEIINAANDLKKLQGVLADLSREETTFAQRILVLERDIESANKKFEKATSNSQESDLLKAQSKFLTNALAQASTFADEIIQKVRQQLQVSISSKFRKVQGCETYTVVVSQNFDVYASNDLGFRADLSEGQKMALAYYFSIALREVVGLNIPLIVDTPLGRVANQNKTTIANALAELVNSGGGHQVILMMHDGEYTPYAKRDFSIAKPLETYLKYVNDNESSIEIGIDPEWQKLDAWKDWAEGKISA